MTEPSPLQNRVRPDGRIVSTPQRGTLFGNRGGRIHNPETRTLFPTRRWASRQWICCVLEFKKRQRAVMGPRSYTELFFLDEVTALAAGHRPCFECRRADAGAFAEAWQRAIGQNKRPAAREMDSVLHRQRLNGRLKRTGKARWQDLPNGAMVMQGDTIVAKHESGALSWSFDGYSPTSTPDDLTDCLTPTAVLGALENGYDPHWHLTARPR